jgi:AcrR family transcriptional regulator
MVVEDERALGVESRRRRAHALMREDILTAARRIMHESGVRGLSMRALGRAVGVTAPTLYDYFASKEAVLDALYREGTDRLLAEMRQAVDTTQPGAARLRALGEAYRRFAFENQDLYLLIFGRADASYHPGQDEITCSRVSFDLLVDTVEEAIALGEIRPGDPQEVASAFWFLAHGYVSLQINGIMQTTTPEEAEALYLAAARYLAGDDRSPPQ